jgi:hypothetical protein
LLAVNLLPFAIVKLHCQSLIQETRRNSTAKLGQFRELNAKDNSSVVASAFRIVDVFCHQYQSIVDDLLHNELGNRDRAHLIEAWEAISTFLESFELVPNVIEPGERATLNCLREDIFHILGDGQC